MKINRIIAMLTVALVGMMMLGASAYAQNPGRRGDRGQKLAQKLNLTQAQKDQIKANREQFKTTNAAALAEIKALREQMKQQLKNNDREGAKATREQIKAKQQALKPAREATREQMKNILTPEQREQLAKLMAERKERIEARRKEWREKHPGRKNLD
jgi:Spy/CpxP family protein refolding chaperone